MLKRVIAVTYLLFFVAGASAQVTSIPPSQPQSKTLDQPRAAEPKYVPQPPTIVYVQPPQKTEAETEQERHERAEKSALDKRLVDLTAELALFTRWLAYSTIALFVATVGIAIFAYFQSRDMKTSIREAKRSADIAEDSLVKLQRCFVAMRDIRHLSHLDTNTGNVWWSLHVAWEKSGTSPTRNLRLCIFRYLEDKDIPTDFDFDMQGMNRPVTFLGPKATTMMEVHVTGEDLAAVRDGKKFLYLLGRADYRDIFENTPNHVTKFFVRVGLRGDPTKVWDPNAVLEIIYSAQAGHNCADDDCTFDAYQKTALS